MAVKAGLYRGMSAVERSAARRAQLLEATLEVWGAEAGPPVTMTRICAEAGLTERYFYEQFTSLEAALEALLQQLSAQITELTVAAIEQTPGGPAERFRAAVAAVVDLVTGDPRAGRVVLLRADSRPELRPLRSRLRLDLAQVAAAEARELYAGEAWSVREGELIGLTFLGGVEVLLASYLDGSLQATPEELVETATRVFVATAHR